MKLVIIHAGISTPSTTELLAHSIRDAIENISLNSDVSVEIKTVAIRDLGIALMNTQLTQIPEEAIEQTLDLLESADGLIALSPVYAGSYAGIFKMFFDLVGNERLAGKPVLIGATGGSIRHSMVPDIYMRPLMVSLRATVITSGIYAGVSDFGDLNTSVLSARIYKAVQDLLIMIKPSLKNQAEFINTVQREINKSDEKQSKSPFLKSNGASGRLVPDVDDFVPMESLLRTGKYLG